MRPDDVLEWSRAVPFRPFRICLNSGRTYDIRHPEMIRVGRSYVNIYSSRGAMATDQPHEHTEMVRAPADRATSSRSRLQSKPEDSRYIPDSIPAFRLATPRPIG